MQGAAMKQSSLQQQRKRMEEIGRVVQGNTAPPYLNSWVACCYLYLIFFKKNDCTSVGAAGLTNKYPVSPRFPICVLREILVKKD
jgi:hypothetical protein